MAEYVLYKGEEVIGIGTAKELAKQHGINEQTVRFYATPSHMRRVENSVDPEDRIIAVKVDDEEESEAKTETGPTKREPAKMASRMRRGAQEL